MDIINSLRLDFTKQSGLSKLYVLERLAQYYIGENCFVQSGFTNEDTGVSTNVETLTRRLDVGFIDKGVPFRDGAVEPNAYIMWVEANVKFDEPDADGRFDINVSGRQHARHLVGVRNNNGQWQYDNNNGWVNFTPKSSDRLLCRIVLTADLSDTATMMNNEDGEISGIKAGYINGDIAFQPNFWDGSPNDGEFGVTGTFFEVLI